MKNKTPKITWLFLRVNILGALKYFTSPNPSSYDNSKFSVVAYYYGLWIESFELDISTAGLIGSTFADKEEADLIQSVAKNLDQIMEVLDLHLIDSKYREIPEWELLVESSRRAYNKVAQFKFDGRANVLSALKFILSPDSSFDDSDEYETSLANYSFQMLELYEDLQLHSDKHRALTEEEARLVASVVKTHHEAMNPYLPDFPMQEYQSLPEWGAVVKASKRALNKMMQAELKTD